MKHRAFLIAAILVGVGTAHAQSKRYPPEPVDKDKETADKSKLWDTASNPNRNPYDEKLARASEHLQPRTTDGAAEAVKVLDEAIALLPKASRAYRMRGEAHTILKEWDKCASDLLAGHANLEKSELDPRSTADLRKKLGSCQARAGKLADAERTLAETAASGTATGEVWMRLGEVRVALGKLEEAQSALETALNSSDVPSKPLVQFILAGAYDRSRRPSEALEIAQTAFNTDRTLTSLRNPNMALLIDGEAEYLQGLAYSAANPSRVEHAIVFYRQYLKVAPDSPWRKRAEDKLRELKDTRLPESNRVDIRGSKFDFDTVKAVSLPVIRKSMPAMRACMAKLPTTVLNLAITRVGPRSAPTVAPTTDLKNPFASRSPHVSRPVYAPLAGVSTAVDPGGISNAPITEVDAAIRCLEPIAGKLALPPVREKDGWYKVEFPVVH